MGKVDIDLGWKLAASLVASVTVGAMQSASAQAPEVPQPPMSAYSSLPTTGSAEMSPDGKKIVYISSIDNKDYIAIRDLETKQTRAVADATSAKAGGVNFVSNEIATFEISTTSKDGARDKYENSRGMALNVDTGKARMLLRNSEGLYPYQSGLGDFVGVSPDKKFVFMPAYSDSSADPSLDLFRVSLKTGSGRVITPRGRHATRDWFVSADGVVLAREDYDQSRQMHSVSARQGRNLEKIYQVETELPFISVMGVSPDQQSLMITQRQNDNSEVYAMSLADGSIAGPVFSKEGADIARLLMDNNRVVYGVQFTGFTPSYAMFDKDVQGHIELVQRTLLESSVRLDSWSEDWSTMLFHVEGGIAAGAYAVYDTATKKLEFVLHSYHDIPAEALGDQVSIEYKARDGMRINGLITWPAGSTEEDRKNLPLIALPHGGPASYDAFGFDWLAQYFANRGYMIFQPNFRGSTGFGTAYRDAGNGEWGKAMQDDVTDGVLAIIKNGWADADRTAIMGWSYGGYAALAGGAYTPDLYKAVVAIAPVSDLPYDLIETKRDLGKNHPVYSYWRTVIGDPKEAKEKLRAVSPVFAAANFQAPVLLIHGRDDTVVDVAHSRRMERALEKAGKPVEAIYLKDADHWMTFNSTRQETLAAAATFIETHMPAK